MQTTIVCTFLDTSRRPRRVISESMLTALLLASASGFLPPTSLAPQSRRDALSTAAAALLASAAPLAASAVGDNKVGYACRGNDDCGVDAQAKARLTATPGQGEAAGIRFGGTYIDPQHPGCTRKIVLAGSNAIITGKDVVDGKEWKAKAKPYGKALLIDFSAKGGPSGGEAFSGQADVVARWNGIGLVFDDGNTWTKK